MKLVIFVLLSFLVSCAHSPYYDQSAGYMNGQSARQGAQDAANAASQAASMPMMMP